MKKLFVQPAKEDWIIDRFAQEWCNDNKDLTTESVNNADLIWLFASWTWRNLPYPLLSTKKVVTTVHHVVPEKFKEKEIAEFKLRDSITTVYHTPNVHTKNFISNFTDKEIVVIPYWANQNIWKKTGTKEFFRKKYNIPKDCYAIGSFQRDTEGSDLMTPKLEKGPDLLGDYLQELKKKKENIHVVLAGWRRQYLIKRLNELSIPFTYVERPPQHIVNELYQTIDLYPVTSRYEGGPQSLIECGLLEIPVISRKMGMAEVVLPSCSIDDNVINCKESIPNVDSLLLPSGYKPYIELFKRFL